MALLYRKVIHLSRRKNYYEKERPLLYFIRYLWSTFDPSFYLISKITGGSMIIQVHSWVVCDFCPGSDVVKLIALRLLLTSEP